MNLQLHHPTRQRKRSLVDAFKDKRNASGEVRRRVSADVKNALSNDQEWGFDILQLERVTENHALTHLGIKVRFEVCYSESAIYGAPFNVAFQTLSV
uniref:Uncharacterized protein n=1 Tax=Parascaris equorum TaxID=6256 RepID=A0A914RMN7_PAREQ